ncbi:putative quinol monooxygenase [Rhodovibrionaceae bacterium A322]
MFVVTVSFNLKPEHVDAFDRRIRQQARDSLEKESGCLVFDVCQDRDRPDRFFLYEVYASAEDFETHKTLPHFLAFSEEVAPWVKSKDLACWQRLSLY